MGKWLAQVLLSVMLSTAGFGLHSPQSHAQPEVRSYDSREAVQALAPASFNVQAKAALLIDLQSGVELYAKDADTALPMASLTKLMTGYIILKHHSLDDIVTVGPSVATVGGDSQRLGIREGEQFTVRELMKGLLVYSANDVAVALASWDAGTEQAFADKMNDVARELGMQHTRFANASGLDAGEHFASARDLSVIARIMLESEVVRSVVKLPTASMRTVTGKNYVMTTTNRLLTQNSEVQGLKTGYTLNAGECLIAYGVLGHKRALSIVLNSPDRFQESDSLIHLALDRISIQ